MNMYHIGKKYNITNNENKLNKKELYKNDNLIEFMRGYIEYNSKLILPYYNEIKLSDSVIFKIYFKIPDYDILNYIYNNWNIICLKVKEKNLKNEIEYDYKLEFQYMNVLEILSKLYYPNVNKNEVNEYLYNQYMSLSNFRYISLDSSNFNLNYNLPKCYYKKVDPYAIVPTKASTSDVGYNLTIIRLHKIISDKIALFDTCIKIKPQFGYYFEIIPRPSISKSGYCLANSFSIINPNSQDSIKIALIKVDESMPDLKLPFKCCQIILRKFTHYELIEDENIFDIKSNIENNDFISNYNKII